MKKIIAAGSLKKMISSGGTSHTPKICRPVLSNQRIKKSESRVVHMMHGSKVLAVLLELLAMATTLSEVTSQATGDHIIRGDVTSYR